jgi:hypothetical protein
MIKRLFGMLILVLGSRLAQAYENPLQFTAPSGARGVTVAGYAIVGETVHGTCSYYTSLSSGGRGARTIITYHYNACVWDLFGNLISTVPVTSAPLPPRMISTSAYEVVYASNGKSNTGLDKRGFGFVNTPTAHYTWETPNGGYAVIGNSNYVFSVILTSDGDFPLVIDKVDIEMAVSGLMTTKAGTAKLLSTSCGSLLPVHSTCSVSISYNPATIGCTTSPYGFAYTVLDLALVTDAGTNPAFKHGFTITGVPICSD